MAGAADPIKWLEIIANPFDDRNLMTGLGTFRLPTRLYRALAGLEHLPDNDNGRVQLWVAVSGGLDSKVLLHLLLHLSRKKNARFQVGAVHLRHYLEQEEPQWEADLHHFAKTLAVPLIVRSARAPQQHPQGMESAARTERHRAWHSLALSQWASAPKLYPDGNFYLALAQHADDRAETLIHRIGRGAGIRGLAVMPANLSWQIEYAQSQRTLCLIRPLIRWQKSDIIDYAQTYGIKGAQDPANADRRRARARIRQEVMPPLVRLFPSFVDSVGRLVEWIEEEQKLRQEWLTNWILPLIEPPLKARHALHGSLKRHAWLKLSPLHQKAIFIYWLEQQMATEDAFGNHYGLSAPRLQMLITKINRQASGAVSLAPKNLESAQVQWSDQTIGYRHFNRSVGE